jgi:hypothetical protein
MSLDYVSLLQEAKDRAEAAEKMMDALDVTFALDKLDEIYPKAKPILRARLARIQQGQDYMRAVDDMNSILGEALREVEEMKIGAKEQVEREEAEATREADRDETGGCSYGQ